MYHGNVGQSVKEAVLAVNRMGQFLLCVVVIQPERVLDFVRKDQHPDSTVIGTDVQLSNESQQQVISDCHEVTSLDT